MARDDVLEIEVVYALRSQQYSVTVALHEGATIADALEHCGLVERLGLDEADLKVGVFGERRALSDTLRAGDRVEIYRPLLDDPKQIRRRRAARSG